MIYRTRWFSPTSVLDVQQGTPTASRHCDGGFLNGDDKSPFAAYRIDGTNLTSVDWNANLTIDPGTYTGGQNINFIAGPNSAAGLPTDGAFKGFNDWANIDLRQVGGRRNVTGLGGLLSVDQTEADSGQNDAGQNDAGQNDAGQNDAGQNDAGQNDAGQNDAGAPLGEADLDAARALGNPVTLLQPVITKAGIVLTWTTPHVDSNLVTDYLVYRVTGTAVNTATLVTKILVSGNPVPAASLTVTDTSAKNNTFYTYWVQAEFSIDGNGNACVNGVNAAGQRCMSGVSNFQPIFDK